MSQKTETVQNNNQPDAEKTPEAETKPDLLKICSHIEFWMGDSNLPRDKFLLNIIEKTDGWVPVEIFLRFNLIKSLKITEKSILVQAIEKSEKLLKLDEKKENAKRTLPMPTEEMLIKRLERHIHFRVNEEHNITKNEFRAHFEKFGKILYFSVNTRKRKSPSYDGSVEFSTLEEAKRALGVDIITTNSEDAEVKELKLTLISSGEIKRKKEAESNKKLMEGFKKGLLMEVRGFPIEMKFFHLRKFLVDALKKNKESEKPEKIPETQTGKIENGTQKRKIDQTTNGSNSSEAANETREDKKAKTPETDVAVEKGKVEEDLATIAKKQNFPLHGAYTNGRPDKVFYGEVINDGTKDRYAILRIREQPPYRSKDIVPDILAGLKKIEKGSDVTIKTFEDDEEGAKAAWLVMATIRQSVMKSRGKGPRGRGRKRAKN